MIITYVRWYPRFRLSHRDLASIAAELGVAVSSGAADKLKQAKDVFDKASAFQSSLFDKNGDDTTILV